MELYVVVLQCLALLFFFSYSQWDDMLLQKNAFV
jgi:hypothetical protein